MKISIITATYNSAKTVRDTIESVLNQTYDNIEYIIVDGGSNDNTLDIVKEYEPKFNGRLKWISEKDNGIYDAMNKGIDLARGEVVGILNSDDLYENSFVIKNVINEFINDAELDAVHANLYYVRNNDINIIVRHWITGDFVEKSFFKGWHPAHPTLFLKMNVYRIYGNFNLNFNLAADFEFMLRIFEVNKIKSRYIPITIVRMRLGGATSKNIINIFKGNKECIKAFRVNNLSPPLLYPFYRLIPKLKQFFNKR